MVEKAPKISPEFRSRLKAMGAHDTVRAVVVVRPGADGAKAGAGRRLSPDQRRAAARATEEATGRAFAAIDQILSAHTGRRLSDRPNALGYVVVESNPAGIAKLAASDQVQAVLEDQRLTLI